MRLIIILGIVVGLATPASATCKWGRWRFYFGTDATAPALADSGVACNLYITQGRSKIDSFIVSRQPSHGHVSIVNYGKYGWVYTSNAGYKGSDEFVGETAGQNFVSDLRGTSKITVSIDVQ
jgi:hypothetical protein